MLEKTFNINKIYSNINIIYEVIFLYTCKKMSIKKIALEKGITETDVFRILKANNIVTRTRNNKF